MLANQILTGQNFEVLNGSRVQGSRLIVQRGSLCHQKKNGACFSDLELPAMERSGSVVECLTRDRGAAGSSLTGVTALCP